MLWSGQWSVFWFILVITKFKWQWRDSYVSIRFSWSGTQTNVLIRIFMCLCCCFGCLLTILQMIYFLLAFVMIDRWKWNYCICMPRNWLITICLDFDSVDRMVPWETFGFSHEFQMLGLWLVLRHWHINNMLSKATMELKLN
jgi:hypothetical protein